MITNLNDATIEDLRNYQDAQGNRGRYRKRPLTDYNTDNSTGSVRVLFRDIKQHLISEIHRADLVVGCVAWLTDFEILTALTHTQGVALLVQKEDFLRPDTGAQNTWKSQLRAAYNKLPLGPSRLEYGGILGSASTFHDGTLPPVRCIGNHNSSKSPAFPRAHHKFAVFCRIEGRPATDNEYDIHPYAAWTGSFNWTKNAGNSLENAVILADPTIVRAFFQEWQQLMVLSEPLDWESDWVAPEWRLGT